MDIIQNSISAQSTEIVVTVNIQKEKDLLTVTIEDNGVGMDEEMVSRVTDPFVTSRSTRRVGLGISLFKASAEQAEGELKLMSKKGIGTTLEASFKLSHIDRLPLGDIAETMVIVVIARPDINYELKLQSLKENFRFSSYEVAEKLGEVPITNYDVIAWIRDFINEGIKITFGGVLDEVVG